MCPETATYTCYLGDFVPLISDVGVAVVIGFAVGAVVVMLRHFFSGSYDN